VIVGCGKPRFFTERKDLFEVEPGSGMLWNTEGGELVGAGCAPTRTPPTNHHQPPINDSPSVPCFSRPRCLFCRLPDDPHRRGRPPLGAARPGQHRASGGGGRRAARRRRARLPGRQLPGPAQDAGHHLGGAGALRGGPHLLGHRAQQEGRGLAHRPGHPRAGGGARGAGVQGGRRGRDAGAAAAAGRAGGPGAPCAGGGVVGEQRPFFCFLCVRVCVAARGCGLASRATRSPLRADV
jgi:hypothetical protein